MCWIWLHGRKEVRWKCGTAADRVVIAELVHDFVSVSSNDSCS